MNWSTLTALLALTTSVSAGAESTAIRPPASPNQPAPEASPPRSSSSARPRTTSPETAAKLNEGLPEYSPPTAADESASAAPEDLREIDRPRNAIIRLPPYDVRDDRLPIFRERELLTQEGRIELVLKRHPGLKFGPLAVLNVRRGLEMLEEEQAVERRAEMSELLSFQRAIESGFFNESARPPSAPASAPAE